MRNPGDRYALTRHNLGGDIVSLLAERGGSKFKRAPRFIRAAVADVRLSGERAVLALPKTFMNESGRAVAPLAKYFGVELDRLLVVHDDIDLAFTKLRLQIGRGSGGNNGAKSVIGSLGTADFWRLRIGVGRPPGRQDPADFVLKRFSSKERPEIDVTIQIAVDIVESFVTVGGETARQIAGDLPS